MLCQPVKISEIILTNHINLQTDKVYLLSKIFPVACSFVSMFILMPTYHELLTRTLVIHGLASDLLNL